MNALTSFVKDTGHIYRGGVTNWDPSMWENSGDSLTDLSNSLLVADRQLTPDT